MTILDEYIMAPPSAQNAVDLFKGEWSSALPTDVASGHIPLYQDSRIDLIAEQVGGFQGKSILELGPLEAAHTYMMDRGGAKSIEAVEANSRAYLKCLVAKEILGIDSAQFWLGDFDKHLLESKKNYDFILACGVIYHCENPVKTLCNLARRADAIGLWSHYYDEKFVRPIYKKKFCYEPEEVEYEGIRAPTYKHSYMNALDLKGFCGGGNPYTRWLPKAEWIRIFEALDFKIHFLSGTEDHPHGPEFTAVAIKNT